MLADKRARLVEQLAEIQDSIDFIDAKQRFYDNVLSGATPYVSVLIPSAVLAEDGSAEHAPASAVSEADDDTAFDTIS